MNRKLLYISIFAISLLGFNSCLFKDDIGDELGTGSIVGDGVLHSGKADSIGYHSDISQSGFDYALDILTEKGILGMIIPAQYSMRGGKQAELPGPHAYQYQFSLQIDNYAGYMCVPQNFDGRLTSTYYNSQDFNGGAMGSFMEVKNAIVPVLNHPQIDSIPEIKAIALLIYNYAAQEVVDIYGAMPYADYKANKQSAPFKYNPGEVVYKTIVNNIDTIVACLDNFDNRPTWYKDGVRNKLEGYDMLSASSDRVSSWKRFANSLKLRMAMNMVKKDPELARVWAEEAVMSGVVDNEKQQMRLAPADLGFTHPLIMISNTWNDTRLNASFETILKAYDHPMLDFVFAKNSHPIINESTGDIVPEETMVVGLRSGIAMGKGQSYDVNFRDAFSGIRTTIAMMELFVMKLSEVDFLRAEGALRGWNMGGSAEYFYNKGIDNAFSGVYLVDFDENWEEIRFEKDIYAPMLDGYKKIEYAKDIEYVDPSDDIYNYRSDIAVGVKWNEADDNETMLEKIITQKYIAGFPYSFGAWNDIRRTGYPRIFPVWHEDTGDGTIVPGDIIRRIPFLPQDENSKNDLATTGLEALGGPDIQGLRVWWDLAQPNF